MKKLTKTQVQHVAKLANLKLTFGELVKFQKQLSEVLSYVEVLNKLDTSNVEPTSQVTGLENVFREDEVTPSLSAKEALSGAKSRNNDYFKIKAIFKE